MATEGGGAVVAKSLVFYFACAIIQVSTLEAEERKRMEKINNTRQYAALFARNDRQYISVNDNFIRGVVFSLLALAIVPLVFATPAHADSISIDLDATTVTLQRSGNLYEHTSSLHVHNSNTYGFTLSMSASQPNLVNSKDSTYKISSVSGTNQHLAANQWGYGMGKTPTVFSSVSSASLADITSDNKGSCTSADDCTFYLTLGANVDPKRLPVGSYSTSLTYTATSKPAPYVPPTPPSPAPEPSTPSSGGGSSSHSALYNLCESRYPSDLNKWEYCFNHDGDMSGYWDKICRERYPGGDTDSLNKKSYCIDYKGDMSGYQPAWDKICRERYPGSGEEFDKWNYCIEHNGDMSGYEDYLKDLWNKTCRGRYPGSDTDSDNRRTYCTFHYGDMSGYLDWLCGGLYSGDNDKISYCKDHNGDMSGYQEPDWRGICLKRYPSYDEEGVAEWQYCVDHHGDMSGYGN